MRMRYFWVALLCVAVPVFAGCNDAKEHFESGMKAFRTEKYEEALSEFSKALDENPNKAEYYIEQGHTYIALEQYDEAREALESAIVEQNLELTRKNNKRAWRAIGISYYKEGNYTEAKAYFEKALAEGLLPELNADIRMYLADALECGGEYDAAIAVYDELLKEQTDYAAGYRARAYMRYMQGNYEASLEDYNAAIALTPNNFDLYFGKYNVLEKLGRNAEQTELLSVITHIESPTPEDAYFIAKAQYFSGAYDEALVGLAAAAEDGFEDAYYYIGEIYHQRSDYGEAVHYFKLYIAGSGVRDAAAYNQMALCLMKQEKYTDALETVRSGQKLADPLHGRQLLFNEVVILERTGEYNTAYERAVEYRNHFPEDTKIKRELEFLASRVREDS